MAAQLVRRLGLCLLIVAFFSGGNCNNTYNRESATTSAPVEALNETPAAANGGPSASPVAMSGNALTLANLINSYRAQAGLAALSTSSANADILAGVAQWHAQDMATNKYIGLVGSDGEDVFTRLANSGYTSSWTGVIADGTSTDPQTIFNSLIVDFSANTILLWNSATPAAFTNIGVGYSDGHWMVILGQ